MAELISELNRRIATEECLREQLAELVPLLKTAAEELDNASYCYHGEDRAGLVELVEEIRTAIAKAEGKSR